jgi:hypothetical protein
VLPGRSSGRVAEDARELRGGTEAELELASIDFDVLGAVLCEREEGRTAPPSTCSADMQSTDPSTVPTRVICHESIRAMPKSEVHDLHGAVAQDPDVAGFPVPVNDPHLVGVAEARRDLLQDAELLSRVEVDPAADDLLDVDPLEELEGDEGDSLVPAVVVDNNNVGVLQLRGGVRPHG